MPPPSAAPLSTAQRIVCRVRRLGRLHGAADVLLFTRVVAVASAVPLLVRLPLPRQSALLTPRKRRRGRPRRSSRQLRADHPGDVERLTRCVDLAQDVAGPLVRAGCLTRGITLYWFLGRADEDITLCFGLGQPGATQDYAGHCWLSRAGRPFLERVDPTESFGVVYRIPASVDA